MNNNLLILHISTIERGWSEVLDEIIKKAVEMFLEKNDLVRTTLFVPLRSVASEFTELVSTISLCNDKLPKKLEGYNIIVATSLSAYDIARKWNIFPIILILHHSIFLKEEKMIESLYAELKKSKK